MIFPLVFKKKWHVLANDICPYCKENKITGSKGFAQLSGGAENGDNGFLYLMLHQEPVECTDNAAIFIAEDVKKDSLIYNSVP